MAVTGSLLGLPGELRNQLYDSIHLLEGVEVVKDRTRLHPLGYTCRQLHLEITSHTAAHATQDATLDVRTWVFDYDFSDIARWLKAHPCTGSELEPRFLKLHLIIRPSASLTGLPLEGTKDDDYEIHLPTSERRLRLLRRNMETWKVGKWSAENFKEENAASEPIIGMPQYLDLHDRRTNCKYIVRFSMKLLEANRYNPCWPKPRQRIAELPASFQSRLGQPRCDYSIRLQKFVFQRYRVQSQAESDFEDCNTILWGQTVGRLGRPGCVPDAMEPVCECSTDFTDIEGEENAYARYHVEERHQLYDRNVLRALKIEEVRCRHLADLREETGRNSMAMSYKNIVGGLSKRVAEDDTRDERKRRAIDVAGMSIEG